MGQKNFGVKDFLGKKINIKKMFGSKRFGSDFFFVKKKTGRVNPRGGYMTPPPENIRVKIVLGCCLFCLVRLPTKFQTPRIIISGRSRVCGVGWGGGWCVK